MSLTLPGVTLSGEWPIAEEADEANIQYRGYNYQYHPAGSGTNTARWNMYVKDPGYYQVVATWQSGPTNASNARYTIQHSGGSTEVQTDQRAATSGYNLGTYYFDQGSYGITLSDRADGRVSC